MNFTSPDRETSEQTIRAKHGKFYCKVEER